MLESLKRVSRSLNFEALLHSLRIKSEGENKFPKKAEKEFLKGLLVERKAFGRLFIGVLSVVLKTAF